MDENAREILSRDPIMKGLLDRCSIKEYWGQQQNTFLDLIEIVIGQQLSVKAAKSIYTRFLSLFPNSPTPFDIADLSLEKLRSIGLSGSKSLYVKNIAQAIINQEIIPDSFDDLSDEEIAGQLLKIKGVGTWTVEMFLIFTLHRPDIFSIGDLGLRTAIEKQYGIKREDREAILKLAETWRPYRTHACRLLWMSLEKV